MRVNKKEGVMKTYHITNIFDANNFFEIQADSPEEAALLALEEIGWSVNIPSITKEEEEIKE